MTCPSGWPPWLEDFPFFCQESENAKRALAKSKVRRLSSLPLRRLPTRCCEVAGRVARAPRVGFGQLRSRKPARACLCAASEVPGCRVSAMMPGWFAGRVGACARCCCCLACVCVCSCVPLPSAAANRQAHAFALHLLCKCFAGLLHDDAWVIDGQAAHALSVCRVLHSVSARSQLANCSHTHACVCTASVVQASNSE